MNKRHTLLECLEAGVPSDGQIRSPPLQRPVIETHCIIHLGHTVNPQIRNWESSGM
jgi:hypothetical protein